MTITKLGPSAAEFDAFRAEVDAHGPAVYSAAWTATETGSWSDWVTESVTVPAGFYLMITSVPYITDGSQDASCRPVVTASTGRYDLWDSRSCYPSDGSCGLRGVVPLWVHSGTVTIRGRVGSSSAKKYGYLKRGGILLVRLW